MKVDLFSIGRFTVHTYGVMIAIGVILCVLMGYYRAKRYEMKAESVLDLAILCVVMGFLGAKVFFVILSWKQFLADPLRVLGSSGFVVYGGIIFGVVSALIYCKIKDIRFFAYFDLLAPSVALHRPLAGWAAFSQAAVMVRRRVCQSELYFRKTVLHRQGYRYCRRSFFLPQVISSLRLC